jgi:hypothetical protein
MKIEQFRLLLAKQFSERELSLLGFNAPDGLESLIRIHSLGLQECLALCLMVIEDTNVRAPRKALDGLLENGYRATPQSMDRAAAMLGLPRAQKGAEAQGGTPMEWSDKLDRMEAEGVVTHEWAQEQRKYL